MKKIFPNKTASPQLWQIIGVLIAVIALIFTVIVTVITKFVSEKKDLRAVVLFKGELLNPKIRNELINRFNQKITIFCNGVEVPNVTLFEVEIKNIGGQSIAGGDFEGPIVVPLKGAQNIPSAKMESSDLNLPIYIKNDSILVSGGLLNPKDSFVIKFIAVPKSEKEVVLVSKIKSRVFGIKEIAFYGSPTEISSIEKDIYFFIISTGLAISFVLLLIFTKRIKIATRSVIAGGGLVVVGIFALILSDKVALSYLYTISGASLVLFGLLRWLGWLGFVVAQITREPAGLTKDELLNQIAKFLADKERLKKLTDREISFLKRIMGTDY